MDSKRVLKVFEPMDQQLCDLSRDLWEHPEVAYTEYYTSDKLKAYLKENGFEVEENAGGIPTAFVARFGSGSPKIGILAEFDALPGFSQKTQTTEEPVVPGGAGHACGHNLMGAAHVGAAVAVKKLMEEEGTKGTVILFGCAAEEVLTGKVFLVRAGVFDGVDCTINFHPGATNAVSMHSCAGLNNVKFNFYGTISHAAARPFDGRSASDAAELMNIGANYLREHLPDGVRVHYVTTEGGKVPNIVPKFAQTWYHIRSKARPDVEDAYRRLIDVAKGAALMTGTTLEIDFQGGCYPTIQNKVLAEAIDKAMREIGVPEYTEEEIAYAKALNESCPQHPRRPYPVDPSIAIPTDIMGLYDEGNFVYNASDIGDVSMLCPTTMFETVCYNFLADLHSWQVAACTGHSIGQKGMLFAAKTMALTVMNLFESPDAIDRAKAEHKAALNGETYICPIPDDILPPVVPGKEA